MGKIKVVFAQGEHNEFGNGDGLPWKSVKEDFSQFKQDTQDSIVIMGAATWKSLPKTLSGRINVVMSSNSVLNKADESPDVRMMGDLRSAIYELQVNYPDKDICIIGGIGLIQEAVKFADEVYVSYMRGHLNHNVTPEKSNRFPCTVKIPHCIINDISMMYVQFDFKEVMLHGHDDVSYWIHKKFKRNI